MIDSRGVADLWGVHPDTARRHLRARFGAGQRSMGAERWPTAKVWCWLFPGRAPPSAPPDPAQSEWE